MSEFKDPSKYLSELIKSVALAEVRLDRIDDKYVPSTIFSSSAIDELKSLDVSFLIASGSSWSTALGWRSFFGYPFAIEGNRCFPLLGKYVPKKHRFMAIGVENVCKHPTRGAYLQSVCFILSYPLTSEAEAAFLTWCDSFPKLQPASTFPEAEQISCSVVRTQSCNLEDHLLWEKWVIEKAKAELVRGNNLYWRTLAFTDSHFDKPTSANRQLIVTSKILESMFSESIIKNKLYSWRTKRIKVLVADYFN